MRTLLIDGDILIYQIAAVSEQECEWDDGVSTIHSDLDVARQELHLQLKALVSRLDADDYVICLSDPKRNFRKELYPDYKANRASKRKPLGLATLRDYCIAKFQTKLKPGLEADDVMGILATMPNSGDTVIVSIDKDLRQIPGLLWDGEHMHSTTKEEGDLLHLLQTLTGDQVDNYPGCPGLGAKRAPEIAEQGWDAVVEAFIKAKKTEEDALVQARLAKILQHENFNYKTGEPILWSA